MESRAEMIHVPHMGIPDIVARPFSPNLDARRTNPVNFPVPSS